MKGGNRTEIFQSAFDTILYEKDIGCVTCIPESPDKSHEKVEHNKSYQFCCDKKLNMKVKIHDEFTIWQKVPGKGENTESSTSLEEWQCCKSPNQL